MYCTAVSRNASIDSEESVLGPQKVTICTRTVVTVPGHNGTITSCVHYIFKLSLMYSCCLRNACTDSLHVATSFNLVCTVCIQHAAIIIGM